MKKERKSHRQTERERTALVLGHFCLGLVGHEPVKKLLAAVGLLDVLDAHVDSLLDDAIAHLLVDLREREREREIQQRPKYIDNQSRASWHAQ